MSTSYRLSLFSIRHKLCCQQIIGSDFLFVYYEAEGLLSRDYRLWFVCLLVCFPWTTVYISISFALKTESPTLVEKLSKWTGT